MLSKVLKNTFATGHLLTWGQTSYGWGRPNNGQPWTPGTVANFNDIESVSTGQYHLGFITHDHSVFTVGLGDDGRLGQGSTNSSDISAVPTRI
jgi:alpha-tubulin suppressor-like RCC1 family protein